MCAGRVSGCALEELSEDSLPRGAADSLEIRGRASKNAGTPCGRLRRCRRASCGSGNATAHSTRRGAEGQNTPPCHYHSLALGHLPQLYHAVIVDSCTGKIGGEGSGDVRDYSPGCHFGMAKPGWRHPIGRHRRALGVWIPYPVIESVAGHRARGDTREG